MKNATALDDPGVNAWDRPQARFQPRGSLGYMAESLAHDLNNVFAPIMTSMEVLQVKIKDEGLRELLVLIQRQTLQGSHLVQQILSFANGVESSHACIQPQSLLQALGKFMAKNSPSNIKVQLQIPANLWEVFGSLYDIYQVLLDLCINAIKRMPQRGTLTIKVENILGDSENLLVPPNSGNARFVLFSVTDTGPALSEEQQEDIFSAAYARTVKLQPGNLGLFAADIIVKLHGGQIKVASQDGLGTTFKVYLPAAPGSPMDVAAEKAVPMGHNECILVVDDEDAILMITRQILEASGYRVITAVNGADAMTAYMHDHDKIALVLMDMNMPYLNGALAIHALRKMNPGIKVIATSGLHTQTQALNALQAGALSFIPKPFQTYDLLRSIDETLKPSVPST
jgi:CheY-like chemotaxis protein